jgi:uncharacterized membrane protein
MSPSVAMLAGVVLPSALSVAIVLFLRQPLFNLLVELCGNAARAQFWAVFSVLFTMLSTVFGVLASLPGSDGSLAEYRGLVLALTLVRAGVLGLLMALVAIAFILLAAIRKYDEADPRRPAA